MTPEQQRAGVSAIVEALTTAGLQPTVGADGRWVTVMCRAGVVHLCTVLAEAGVVAHVEKTRAALVFRVHPRHEQAQPRLRVVRDV